VSTIFFSGTHSSDEMRGSLIAVVTILVLVVCLWWWLTRKKKETFTDDKIIWSYWNEEQLPPFIQKCVDTWHKENPNYTVNIVNDQNLEKFVGQEEADDIKKWKYNDSPQRMSDLVRLSVLTKHGGVWLDASIICYESLDWVFSEHPGKPKVYSIPELSTPEDPLIESWFISCRPGDPFVSRWNEEFRRVADYETIEDYVKDVDVSMKGIDFPNYLLVYVCAKKVYRELGPDSVKVLDASDGPYNYHLHGGVSSMCERKPTRLIKLRKEDRAGLDENLEACAFVRSQSS
jgi:hypothetical protein